MTSIIPDNQFPRNKSGQINIQHRNRKSHGNHKHERCILTLPLPHNWSEMDEISPDDNRTQVIFLQDPYMNFPPFSIKKL